MRFALPLLIASFFPQSPQACQWIPPDRFVFHYSCEAMPVGLSLQTGPAYERALEKVVYLQNLGSVETIVLSRNPLLLKDQAKNSPSLVYGQPHRFSALSMIKSGREFIYDLNKKAFVPRGIPFVDRINYFRGLQIDFRTINDHFLIASRLDPKAVYDWPPSKMPMPDPIPFQIPIFQTGKISMLSCLGVYAANPNLEKEWEDLKKKRCPS